MLDYGVRRKTEFLERWWNAVDWNKVEDGIRTEGYSDEDRLRRGNFIS